ncbi:hypothetical protein LUZ63_016437 [Rhynchospora breviuscula]|uniref:S-adenosyl-L-methionine-dependent methyltransferase n=1 Tax=Rhynchospora breviuscula TaxID=2022672 RepID=A0A9P9ZBV0_9POAL|nr:hypothetical protein LUZ63_016437 [Rhynchospora breviuscula]
MVWSPESAANAYLDTLKLCKNELERKKSDPSVIPVQPQKSEFISALAAGTSAQLIVEVSPEASHSTIALAAAARQTGGRLVCILPQEESLAPSKEVMEESGLDDIVDFQVGDPAELLPKYENIDFSLVDCNSEYYEDVLKIIDVNPKKSVVVANNIKEGREGLSVEVPGGKDGMVRSEKHMIGNRMEVTMIGRNAGMGWMKKGKEGVNTTSPDKRRRPKRKIRWVKKIDEQSGEEHLYRLAKSL